MKVIKHNRATLVGFGFMLMATSAQASSFAINLQFDPALDVSYRSYFTRAQNFWESIITGYNSKVTSNQITGLTITAGVLPSDGLNGVLGSAGPQTLWNSFRAGGYALAQTGVMDFDLADINNLIGNGSFLSVVEHEMAHVLGFGTLWTTNNLYSNGTGQYTGSFGLAAYKAEFAQSTATYIPVELGGSVGTANGHWNEVDNGAGNTGIKDALGRDMKNELMTGWLNSPTFLSNTTIQSFRDLGYSVAQVPLPTATWLFMTALFAILGVSKARRRG
jgi:hypothetical protein